MMVGYERIESDHAHGNKPALHSHLGERGMGFGHTMADHRQAGDLGSPAYHSTQVFVSGGYCAICNGECVGHSRDYIDLSDPPQSWDDR